jgi:hypothetical protein
MMAETTKKLTVNRKEAQQYYGEIEPFAISVTIEEAETIAQATNGVVIIGSGEKWAQYGRCSVDNAKSACFGGGNLEGIVFTAMDKDVQEQIEAGNRDVRINARMLVMEGIDTEITEYERKEAKKAKEREKQAALREAEEETWAKDAKEFVKRLEAGEWDPVIRTKSSGDMYLIDSTYYLFDSDRGKSEVMGILEKISEPALLRKLLEEQKERIKRLLEKIEELEQSRESSKEEILREIAEEGGFSLTEEGEVSYRVEEDE